MITLFSSRNKSIWLNIYQFSEVSTNWNVKYFEEHNEEWLDFVTNCRLGLDNSNFDMVVGGVANDKVFETVDAYFAGIMSKDKAQIRLN